MKKARFRGLRRFWTALLLRRQVQPVCDQRNDGCVLSRCSDVERSDNEQSDDS